MLYDQQGNRKYLTRNERQAFMDAASRAAPEIETFCLTLAYTGARISEVLALVPLRIDRSAKAIIIESLKKRKRGIYRAIPVPANMLERLDNVHNIFSRQCDPVRSQMRDLDLESHDRVGPSENYHAHCRNCGRPSNAKGLAACFWSWGNAVRCPAQHYPTMVGPRRYSNDRDLHGCDGR